ncbi:hypothetical protein CLAFUW4_10384 [Fulvia fulva]|uniref:Uncharacterized protein n=1 Tax=Passalora fulva TaxID=5499 RepID=A0A9Q8LFG1_PASFU|nr:uncharacterized protein CLAFUR5_04999 [Fulvia fulva]KAK4615677.1 hypothetical protein CLAFUR4_10388 [Fulvia fulva]KAK4616574.1 hypothetical protein CLAFUR0_10389 [Fulvia fulva]UJO16477.1 hypothetical protein CLAFUR5_04999 [Fulvia fulva]WPV19173.1 hypothetical protein CLAFUW4_10384 [Fulvia fulva]WPV34021.1 hypothetical protein CLAFUW7_10384 [Fulvia fulva]
MSDSQTKEVQVAVLARSPSDGSSSTLSIKPPSLKSPRTARFAEATAVNSPIEPSKTGRNPFKDPPTKYYMAQPQDVGFGYINKHESVEMPDDEYQPPLTARTIPKTPLKSAMKTPGAPPRDMNAILSPTFREEQVLEKHEAYTEKEQAKDLKVKTRVRIAKLMLRGVNFSCSLIVIAMLATTFTIFNATKAIPTRNNLPPWATGQKVWPQALLLGIACVSLFACIIIFHAYWKGGHRRAEKMAVYYTAFAVAFFIFSIVMWGVGAAVIQQSKNNSNNKDMWGWACVNNERKSLFENEVDYELICRLQNWSLVCAIIEIVVEIIVIIVYGIVFHRFYSKRQLRKSMAARDRARSDLYLAQLRGQSAPNTPGLAPPMSARDGGWRPPADYYNKGPQIEEGVQYVDATPPAVPSAGFKLQAPPIKITGATPKMAQVGFSPVATQARDRTPSPPQDQHSPLMAEAPREVQNDHFAAAPGEQVYDSVPIPGAYEAPLSPGAEHRQMNLPSR